MKINKKWSHLMVIFVCVVLACLLQDMTVYAYTSDNHPYSGHTADGGAWTIVDPLPEESYTDGDYTFWYEKGTTVTTGTTLNLVENSVGVGQHTYKYKRTGMVPVYKWVVQHRTASCIHDITDDDFHGLDTTVNKCYMPYWSGWFPYCADCGEIVVQAYHYLKKESAQTLDTINLAKAYYYLCPHNNKLEQGYEKIPHMCDGISYNRYAVKYEANCSSLYYTGSMGDSFHMYNNASLYEGNEVSPNPHLSKNQYSRSGYTFVGWNTAADGSGTTYEDEAVIYNLTEENYDDVTGTGIITLYAMWTKTESTLMLGVNGGTYTDTKGTWDAATTTRTYGDIPYGSQLELDADKLTPPSGYTVSFQTNGGSAVSPITSTKIFDSWRMTEPFGGRFVDDVYYFLGTNGNVDIIEVVYRNGSITLPGTTRSGYNFGGWYADAGLTQFVGVAGDTYTPTANKTLYASWVDLTLYAEAEPSLAGGKGGANLKWSQTDNTNKVFKLYRKLTSEADSAYQELFNQNADGSTYSVSQIYEYTGSASTYTVPYSGVYTFIGYGAQGASYGSYTGGKGGYVTANIWLNKGDVLTVVVGGQNGFDGGGSATAYGNGGGMSYVNSAEKGTLIIAGGGGGASPAGNGGPGGASTSLVASGNSGESGMAGGGAGLLGGKAGENIYHNHTTSGCIQHSHTGNATTGGGCYGKENTITCGTYTKKVDIYYQCSCGFTCGTESYSYFKDASTHSGHTWGQVNNWACTGCGAKGTMNATHSTTTYEMNCAYVSATNLWLCGKTETDVESSKPAYGGSNYVIATAISSNSLPNEKPGNGYISIVSNNVGYLSEYEKNDETANDLAKPDSIDLNTVKQKEDGVNAVKVTWDAVEDNGTFYDHLCKSFSIGTGELICTSNETTVEVVTGVKYYYYIYDTNATTVITSTNREGYVLAANRSAHLGTVQGTTYYFHLAAVDQAGNISDTVHIPVTGNDVAWSISTEQINISSVVGSRDFESIYPSGEKTYYVKADGRTPFNLSFWAKVNGIARSDYQVDNLLFKVSQQGSTKTQTLTNTFPHTLVAAAGRQDVSSSMIFRASNGSVLLKDAMNVSAYRTNYAISTYYSQAFYIPASLSGTTLQVIPGAGAEYTAADGWVDIKYSDETADSANAIILKPDGEAPVIGGADALFNIKDMDTDNDNEIEIVLNATDALSGIKLFYCVINNTDNYTTREYLSDDNGTIRLQIDLSEENSIFAGSFCINIVAQDNVGNISELEYVVTEFDLQTEISRILIPNEPDFKGGESGILNIVTYGYADRVVVEFPEELTSNDATINKVFRYNQNLQYKAEETIEFMVPLDAPPGNYCVTVRAYKGDEELVSYPAFTIRSDGTILDELRTRLR